jgi:hypothetical protein
VETIRLMIDAVRDGPSGGTVGPLTGSPRTA